MDVNRSGGYLGRMNSSGTRKKWDERYRGTEGPATPLEVLTDNAHLLPASGEALDLACGLGGSALYLAGLGFRTRAWDLSRVAIDRLRRRVATEEILAEERDVLAHPPDPDSFDVICVGHFLARPLCPRIAAALRPGGLLYYQTFTEDRVDDGGPGNPAFRLRRNELLRLFPDLVVRLYREEGCVGDVTKGLRNRAQLIAQRAP